jgi:hypothetical protein
MDPEPASPSSNLSTVGWTFWIAALCALGWSIFADDSGAPLWKVMVFQAGLIAAVIGTICLGSEAIVKAIKRQ